MVRCCHWGSRLMNVEKSRKRGVVQRLIPQSTYLTLRPCVHSCNKLALLVYCMVSITVNDMILILPSDEIQQHWGLTTFYGVSQRPNFPQSPGIQELSPTGHLLCPMRAQGLKSKVSVTTLQHKKMLGHLVKVAPFCAVKWPFLVILWVSYTCIGLNVYECKATFSISAFQGRSLGYSTLTALIPEKV